MESQTVEETISAVSIPKIEQELRELNIQHSSLRFDSSRNNISLTDYKHVFIKLSKTDTLKALNNEAMFISSNKEHLHTLKLLHDEPIKLEGETVHYFTVWEYAPHLVQYSFEELKNDSSISSNMIENLHKIHSLPNLPQKVYTAEDVLDTIDSRIRFGLNAFKDSIPKEHLKLLQELSDTFIRPEIFTRTTPVPCHGDAHIGNFIHDAQIGRSFWTDFESACQASKELDLAVLSITYRRILKNEDFYLSLIEEYQRYGDIDFGLLEEYELIKCVSNTSYILMSYASQKEVFENRLFGIADVMNGAPFPKNYMSHLVDKW